MAPSLALAVRFGLGDEERRRLKLSIVGNRLEEWEWDNSG